MPKTPSALTDETAETICRTIAAGFSKGAYPIGPDGKQIGWYDWLRQQIGPADMRAALHEMTETYWGVDHDDNGDGGEPPTMIVNARKALGVTA